MISTDDNSPPDPSSFNHHQSQQKSSDFKSLFPEIYDTNSPLPNFSIRDYVFNSRNKDIACNWPFSQKSLQICLKNEVKNLLPPFESLKSLRNNSSNEEITVSLDGKSNSELTSVSLNTTKGSKDGKESQEVSGQKKSKKFVLVSSGKLNTSVERIKEVTHMASKVCPVCKIYSSSSNTALNAHIDQCLSGESSTKCTTNPKEIVKPSIKPSLKPRIKPRKMRLMSDIYKTAPHCTVEELDARNGRTSRADNSSFPAQELEFQGEEETQVTTIVPEVADHEGDVYIDSNGTKVRILSVPKVGTSKDLGARKLFTRGQSSKVFTGNQKNKNLKLSPSDKKLCSPNPSKVKTVRKENNDIEESCKNDRVEEVMNRDDYPIVRPPWACSKRTVLAKKLRANLVTPLPLTKPTYLDSCLLKSSNVGSKSSKLSSPRKKLLSVRRDPTSKFTLKKKVSALKKSSVRSLSKQNFVVGPSQDSSKRVEEAASGKTFSARKETNIMVVGKNKETKISIPKRSVVSERPNGDSTDIMDLPSLDVESARKETRSHNEQVEVTRSSLAINNSLNLELPNDKEMNCADIIKSKACTDNIEADIVMQEVNLPVSEERQGNSSLASGEQHYYDMSDSPISTISNPILARSDSDKFSVRSSTFLKGDTRGLPGAINDIYAPIISTGASKNDHHCRCSRKEPASSQTVASSFHESTLLKKRSIESFNFKPQMFSVSNYPTSEPTPPLFDTIDSLPPIRLSAYNECDSVGSPSKPVLRLMGKNLTVVNTNEQKNNYGQFANVQNEQKFPSNDTMFRSITYADYFNPHVASMTPQDRAHENRNRFDDQMVINDMNMHMPPSNSINDPIIIDDSPKIGHNYTPFGYQSQNAVAFSNGGVQACFPFGKWYRTPTAGSSRSSAM